MSQGQRFAGCQYSQNSSINQIRYASSREAQQVQWTREDCCRAIYFIEMLDSLNYAHLQHQTYWMAVSSPFPLICIVLQRPGCPTGRPTFRPSHAYNLFQISRHVASSPHPPLPLRHDAMPLHCVLIDDRWALRCSTPCTADTT
jgi:hypothetical protein